MKNLLKSIFILFGALTLVTLATNSYYTDQVTVSGNEFSAGVWETPTPGPTPTPTPILQARVVINEVYYDVAEDKGSEPGDEWLELYNAGNVSVNLKDWTITDNSTTRTINAIHTLTPGAYALVAKDHSVWSLHWTVPAGAEIIELGSNIGNGLSNTGDRLILKDDQGNIVDQISYGADTTILSPSIVDVGDGHSIERSPAGADADSAADFIDRVVPTPGN